MIRLFVAIDLPEHILEKICSICHGVPGIKWMPVEQLHLTLRFIGEVDDENFHDISTALHSIHFSPFELTIRGIGQFMNNKWPVVLWVGIKESQALLRLHRLIEKTLTETGIKPEKKKFHPHITMARLRSIPLQRLEFYLNEYNSFETPPFVISEFQLFSSRLRSKGALHCVEERYGLSEEKGVAVN